MARLLSKDIPDIEVYLQLPILVYALFINMTQSLLRCSFMSLFADTIAELCFSHSLMTVCVRGILNGRQQLFDSNIYERLFCLSLNHAV